MTGAPDRGSSLSETFPLVGRTPRWQRSLADSFREDLTLEARLPLSGVLGNSVAASKGVHGAAEQELGCVIT